jgi:hypothetical protein
MQLWAALRELFGPSVDAFREKLGTPGKIIPIPGPPKLAEIDILTSIGDLDFEVIYANRRYLRLRNLVLPIPSLEGLIATKRIAVEHGERKLGELTHGTRDFLRANVHLLKDRTDLQSLEDLGGD